MGCFRICKTSKSSSLNLHNWENAENSAFQIQERLSTGGACVLEIGCSDGAWMIRMSEKFQSSKFLGVDDLEIFLKEESQPSNVNFFKCNVLENLSGIPWNDNTFDIVVQRLTLFTITEEQLLRCIMDCIRVLKPGGYLVFVEQYNGARGRQREYGVLAKTSAHLSSKKIKPFICTCTNLRHLRFIEFKEKNQDIPQNFRLSTIEPFSKKSTEKKKEQKMVRTYNFVCLFVCLIFIKF
ncbi:hypothetical protein G9A89_001141 [Geosiphon pyriformis]|nr:hypothetical protein G9A89_001141 [Geosiphon pyriformis]